MSYAEVHGPRSPTTRGHPRATRASAAARSSSEELAEIAEKYGDERRTRLVAYEGDLSNEDLIAREDVVVTVTRGVDYAKRTKVDLYRQQRRGGKGVQGATSCARTTSSSTSS